jgi:hypothetical protein
LHCQYHSLMRSQELPGSQHVEPVGASAPAELDRPPHWPHSGMVDVHELPTPPGFG